MASSRILSLGEVVELQRGYDLPEAKRRAGSVPVIGSAGITGYHDTAKVPGPGVTLGRAGASFGKVTFVAEPFWPHNATLFVKDFKGNDVRFVRYLLESIDFSSINSGAAQPMLNRNYAYLLQVNLPAPATQRRIASILSEYDDLIENCERRIRVLEEMARTLYREWFVLFRYPGHEKKPLVDSAVGPIPKGWEVRRLGEVLELHYGRALKAEHRRGGSVPVFASSGVVGWHDEWLAAGPGIILGRKGNVGSIFWADTDFFVIDTAYYVSSMLPLRFLFFDLQGKNFINGDAAVPGLSRQQAYALPTVVPPVPLLHRFQELADGFLTSASTLARSATNLRRTRDLLLPRLLSGQLSVEDAA